MIHADVSVASRTELVDRQRKDPELRIRRRQVVDGDPALRLEQMGNVGIPIKRDVVR
jgi:hypothetical protein